MVKLNSPRFHNNTKSCVLRNENIIIIWYEIYNFNITVKDGNKVQIRVYNYIFQVKKTDYSVCGGGSFSCYTDHVHKPITLRQFNSLNKVNKLNMSSRQPVWTDQ